MPIGFVLPFVCLRSVIYPFTINRKNNLVS